MLSSLATIGSRAAALTLRPVTGAVGVAAGAGIGLERRAMDRLLDSGELERMLDSARLQAVFEQVLDSDGAKHLLDAIFDSGLFDRLVDRLLTSDGLWRLVDEIATSPAVIAAVSQQGLGFADQVGGEVRRRSRRADEMLERVAQRLVRRDRDAAAPLPETTS